MSENVPLRELYALALNDKLKVAAKQLDKIDDDDLYKVVMDNSYWVDIPSRIYDRKNAITI